MTLNFIYLVFETWCTFMNSYKHLVHLKSTTRKQSVLSFVYNFGVYIWIFWCWGETQSVNLIKLPQMTTGTVTEVICSWKGLFLAQKRCHTLELLNQVSRKREKHGWHNEESSWRRLREIHVSAQRTTQPCHRDPEKRALPFRTFRC